MLVVSSRTIQQGYRRDTSEVVTQDHIAKSRKFELHEFTFAMHQLIATHVENTKMTSKPPIKA